MSLDALTLEANLDVTNINDKKDQSVLEEESL